MATMRNPQQVAHAPCEDARIGRSAHGIESYHPLLKDEAWQIPFFWEGENRPMRWNSLDNWWVPKSVRRSAPYRT